MNMPFFEGHTAGHEECPACARANAMLFRALSGELLFGEAFRTWMMRRSIHCGGERAEINYLAGQTERDYITCARALEHFFGRLRLKDIHAGHIVEYQRLRQSNAIDPRGEFRLLRGQGVHGPFETRDEAETWAKAHGGGYTVTQTVWPRAAGANAIRKEVALLLRVLRAAELWSEVDQRRLPRLRSHEPEARRAMTVAEQHRLLHVASERLEYRTIYQYAILALQTTAGPNELRSMRLADALAEDMLIQIPPRGAKNKYRSRSIPLVTEEAQWALRGLVARARELGATQPAHYLFPFRVSRGKWDVTRPMSESGLKKQWDRLRRAAGMPELRIYDLRHTGLTRMAEGGMPAPVAMGYAGHTTRKTHQRYVSVCAASQRAWGAEVWGESARKPVRSETAPGLVGRRA